MKIYVTRHFKKWLKNEDVSNEALIKAIDEIEAGLVDAKLGKNLVKKRVPASNRGKSGSYRTIIAIKSGDKSFFIAGFAKNEKDNVSRKELKALKALSKILLDASPSDIEKMLEGNVIVKISE